ncbi:cytochrome oxidase putative small subunit CydP [Methylophaga sp.]|uniref:cytochrome oxidase putative small subunit CydP n=1 Tax=Methylophaga sp. TaxID=2024840 RepID=UPI003F6A3CB6
MRNKLLLTDRKLLLELAIVLVLKLFLLFIIWHHFFSTPPNLDNTQSTAERLLHHSSQGERP